MLTIHSTIPTDMEYVKDNEEYFGRVTYDKMDASANHIIESIELGTYSGGPTFWDRLKRPIYITDLSTGCKTLLNIYYNTDVCFDTIECGYNALTFILSMTHGNAYMSSDTFFGAITLGDIYWKGFGKINTIDDLALAFKEVWPDEDY